MLTSQVHNVNDFLIKLYICIYARNLNYLIKEKLLMKI